MNSTKAASTLPTRDGASRNLASICPFFIVKDLQASIAYYIERMGFQLDFQGPNDDVYYGQVSRDGIGIMLKTIGPDVLPRPNHTRHEWARWDAYVYTLDPDTLFAEFTERGVSFVKELSFIDQGLWGFEIADADGYVVAFFQLRNQP
jgi:catechol 2,3-dioxygenase-like lactoylglutathione lyase family enzyme